ncbi:MAG: glycosyltransferase [Bacteroidota bacterium]
MLPEVLMLGWEFPPQFNGGLGVASMSMAEALAPYVNLNLIVPHAAENTPNQGYGVYGVNELAALAGKEDSRTLLRNSAGIIYVPSSLRPYEMPRVSADPVRKLLYVEGNRGPQLSTQEESSESPSLYDAQLGKRVMDFAQRSGELAEKQSFDLIHAHDWMTWLAGLEIRAKSGKPLLLHVHSLEIDRNPDQPHPWIMQLERHAMQQADGIVAVSEYTARRIRQYYAVEAEKIQVIHNGVALREIAPESAAFPEKLVVFIGRMTTQKDPEQFIDIAMRVLMEEDRVRFIMAGDGDLIPEVSKLIAKYRVGHRIHLTGFLEPEVRDRLLGMADVLVMPSQAEPFGLVALEAAHAGVPCVISSQSGVREVLPNALVSEPDRPDHMASQVLSLLRYPTLHQTISTALKADAAQANWERNAMQLIDTYQDLCLPE